MTNREAAAHFAAKDPDQKAEILMIDGNYGTVEKMSLKTTDDNDLEECEELDGDEKAFLNVSAIIW